MMATYQWDSPYTGKYHTVINGKRLEIEREKGSALPRYNMYVDKQHLGTYPQLGGAKSKLVKYATGQPNNLVKRNNLPREMPARETLKAQLEAAGYKVTDTNLDKAASAKVASLTRPSGLTVKMTPAEVLKICAKHSKTGQQLLEETERTGELPPVALEDDSDIFGEDDYPEFAESDLWMDDIVPEPERQAVEKAIAKPIPLVTEEAIDKPIEKPVVPMIAPAAPEPSELHTSMLRNEDCPPGMAYVQITGYLPVELLKDAKATVELLKACGEFRAHVKLPADLDF